MERREQLYEGKAKIIYATDDPKVVIQYFKDDATAFNAQKKGTIQSKGIYNNKISSKIFQLLAKEGIESHYVEYLNEREMAVKKLDIVLIEVVVRNVVAGSLSKRMGRPEGERLSRTIVEYYYKDDDLGDPMISEEHIDVFNLATAAELATMKAQALKVNDFLVPYFSQNGIDLIDYKLEFGRHEAENGTQILLGDEITPDGCRLWDAQTQEKLDKDRFRRDLGNIEEAYERVYQTVCGADFES